MIVYNIEYYAYLPKMLIYIFLHFDFRSDPDLFAAVPDSDPWKQMSDPHPWLYYHQIMIQGLEISLNIILYEIDGKFLK